MRHDTFPMQVAIMFYAAEFHSPITLVSLSGDGTFGATTYNPNQHESQTVENMNATPFSMLYMNANHFEPLVSHYESSVPI